MSFLWKGQGEGSSFRILFLCSQRKINMQEPPSKFCFLARTVHWPLSNSHFGRIWGFSQTMQDFFLSDTRKKKVRLTGRIHTILNLSLWDRKHNFKVPYLTHTYVDIIQKGKMLIHNITSTSHRILVKKNWLYIMERIVVEKIWCKF
jgi:hypothetical protein